MHFTPKKGAATPHWCFLRPRGALLLLNMDLTPPPPPLTCALYVQDGVKCPDMFLLSSSGIVMYKGEEHKDSKMLKVEHSHWWTLMGVLFRSGLGLIPSTINRVLPPHSFFANLQESIESTHFECESCILKIRRDRRATYKSISKVILMGGGGGGRGAKVREEVIHVG
ncbi:hypothetical protein LXL04_028790 [Taraxacum kok-saghyz]